MKWFLIGLIVIVLFYLSRFGREMFDVNKRSRNSGIIDPLFHPRSPGSTQGIIDPLFHPGNTQGIIDPLFRVGYH
jgi:hypothetical protein